MAKKTFTYQEEKDGAVEKYIALNPVHVRWNFADHLEILTGDDTPKAPAINTDESLTQ